MALEPRCTRMGRDKKKHLDAEGDGYDDGQHAEGKVGVRRVPFELRGRSWRLERIRAHRPRPVSTVLAGLYHGTDIQHLLNFPRDVGLMRLIGKLNAKTETAPRFALVTSPSFLRRPLL